jgi:hypothetical protein
MRFETEQSENLSCYFDPSHPLTSVRTSLSTTDQQWAKVAFSAMILAIAVYLVACVLGLMVLHDYKWLWDRFERFETPIAVTVAARRDVAISV